MGKRIVRLSAGRNELSAVKIGPVALTWPIQFRGGAVFFVWPFSSVPRIESMNITPQQAMRTREASQWFEEQDRRAEWSVAEREAWERWSADADNMAEYEEQLVRL